jgi:hypothetical protein
MDDAQVDSESQKDVLEIVSNTSLIDFLNNEEDCENLDEVQLFSEINRLASLNSSKFPSQDDDRTIEELLKEAETLINQPIGAENPMISCESTPIEIRNNIIDRYDYSTVHTLSHHDVSLTTFIVSCLCYSARKYLHESQRLFARANDLVCGQDKPMATCISELDREGVFELHGALGPVVTAACCGVEGTSSRSHRVLEAMHRLHRLSCRLTDSLEVLVIWRDFPVVSPRV